MKAANPTRYNHVWRGHWAQQAAGALWTWEMIDKHRHRPPARLPAFARVVVAIDPAGKDKETADETGIGCAAVDFSGHYYILSDLTRHASPMEWATVAIGEYKTRQADRIVAEVNFGGDMVESTLRNVDQTISYQAVCASRGKTIRSEPVAALYEQGLVHHVGAFPELETEQMTYVGRPGEKSPNRLDWMVWAITALMNGLGMAALASASPAEMERVQAIRGKPGYIDLTPSQRRAGGRSFADVY